LRLGKTLGVKANTTKKRILVFIDWYLPGYKAGGGQRAFANLVSYLREEFEFFVVTRNCDFLESEPYTGIIQHKWQILSEGENIYYLPEKDVSGKLYKQLVKEVQPDAVYVNGVYSWKFSILPLLVLKRLNYRNRILLGTYGMLAPAAIHIKGWKKRLFISVARIVGLYKQVVFHATSNQEERDIKVVFGDSQRILRAPHLPAKDFPPIREIMKERGVLKLISVARISPEKNTLFALKVLSEVKNCQILFDLYGPKYDVEYWTNCQRSIGRLPSNVTVNYKGVAEGGRVLELISGYHALFMPTRGENFGYAILESFMAGRPVIISDQTPWKNLIEKNAGFDLPLEKPQQFVEKIENLADMTQTTFDNLCRGAHNEAIGFVEDPELRAANRGLFL
jgi:glycosyltransferase involved in cell wall biosynthesis